MTVLHCWRCGRLFGTSERFMTVDVDVARGFDREVVAQILLCAACTDAIADSISIETTVHEPSRPSA